MFDFDAKGNHTPEEVQADVERLQAWIAECGGVSVSDIGTSGGRHVYVPLAHGELIPARHIEPLLRLLADRLRTLDITPMTNPTTGCITVPGSACREGGYRRLVGDLDAAVDAFTTRSEPRLIARMVELLGGGLHNRPASGRAPRSSPDATSPAAADRCEGNGAAVRLRPEWCLLSPIPAAVASYASGEGLPPDGRWPSHSEARQSVLAAAALRGMSLDDVQHRIDTGDWPGLDRAYDRYGHQASARLQADWIKACRWAAQYAPEFQSPGHKTWHTGGKGTASVDHPLTAWLASAYAWIDTEYVRSGPAHRESLRALLQGMAWGAYITGSSGDTPTVALGVRGIAIAAGLLAKTTVADLLTDLRERPGSPLLRIRRAAGLLPDRYAMVTPRIDGQPATPIPLDRVQVAPVHDAWRILGLRGRRLYDLVHTTGLCRPEDLFAAAGVSLSTGHAILSDLQIRGLIRRTRGHVSLGERTLDDVAAAHDVAQLRADTIARFQADRAEWAAWLEIVFAAAYIDDPGPLPDSPVPPDPWDITEDREAWWRSTLADGPPEEPFAPHPKAELASTDGGEADDAAALDLLISELGASLLA
ncbi:hypothetical protein ACGF5S_32845 [Nocardia nova]|uniref:hypothetical protein n=1 Tax=Nocardia nova TaxID=37330 RepID=UPI00371878A5